MRYMTLAVLCCLALGRYAGAWEKPPEDPLRQRSWLRRGLVNDMTEVNQWMPSTFADQAFQRADAVAILAEPITPAYKNAIWPFRISDDRDVKPLADFYFQTRARIEEDLQQLRRQLAAGGQFPGQLPAAGPLLNAPQEAELKAAQAGGDAILDLGEKLARRSETVKNLAALIYFSVPGVCLRERQVIPASYFQRDPGTGAFLYVGPVYEAYARRYAAHYEAQHAGRYAGNENVTAAAAPVQLPTWFPRQPDCIEWNRINAIRTMQQAPIRRNPTPNGVWPGYGNAGNNVRGR
jgi:hypothetical protein